SRAALRHGRPRHRVRAVPRRGRDPRRLGGARGGRAAACARGARRAQREGDRTRSGASRPTRRAGCASRSGGRLRSSARGARPLAEPRSGPPAAFRARRRPSARPCLPRPRPATRRGVFAQEARSALPPIQPRSRSHRSPAVARGAPARRARPPRRGSAQPPRGLDLPVLRRADLRRPPRRARLLGSPRRTRSDRDRPRAPRPVLGASRDVRGGPLRGSRHGRASPAPDRRGERGPGDFSESRALLPPRPAAATENRAENALGACGTPTRARDPDAPVPRRLHTGGVRDRGVGGREATGGSRSMTTSPPPSRPRRIAVAQQKGGTGKTSTAVNLGAALAARGQTVLLIDVDPQASASAWLARGLADPPFLEQVLAGAVPARDAIRATACPGLSLLPASLALAVQERRMAGEIGAEQLLAERLADLDGFDVVLLDAPPELGLLAFNALTAAREVLVPVVPEPLALRGLEQLLAT